MHIKYLYELGKRYDRLRFYYNKSNTVPANQAAIDLAHSYNRIQTHNETYITSTQRSESVFSKKRVYLSKFQSDPIEEDDDEDISMNIQTEAEKKNLKLNLAAKMSKEKVPKIFNGQEEELKEEGGTVRNE